MDNQVDEEKGLEFVQNSDLNVATTREGRMMDSFRPAANMAASEVELRQISRKVRKSRVSLAREPMKHRVSRSGTTPHGKMGAKVIRSQSYLALPAASIDLLEAREFQMGQLNRQREMDLHQMKKQEEYSRRRSILRYAPDGHEFMPEQIAPIDNLGTIRRGRYNDNLDVSLHPSYTKLEIPYHMKCLERIRASKRKYEMQFRYELEMLEDAQGSAYEAARFAQFLGTEALQKVNYSPRAVKITPKERQRINYLLREVQR